MYQQITQPKFKLINNVNSQKVTLLSHFTQKQHKEIMVCIANKCHILQFYNYLAKMKIMPYNNK